MGWESSIKCASCWRHSETTLFKGTDRLKGHKQHSTANCHCKGDGTALLVLNKTDFQSEGRETKSHLSNSSTQHSEREKLKLLSGPGVGERCLLSALLWTEDSCQCDKARSKGIGFWKTKQNYLLHRWHNPICKNLSHRVRRAISGSGDTELLLASPTRTRISRTHTIGLENWLPQVVLWQSAHTWTHRINTFEKELVMRSSCLPARTSIYKTQYFIK